MNAYQIFSWVDITFCISIFLPILWLILIICSYFTVVVWNWIDDGDKKEIFNPVIKNIMFKLGYQLNKNWAVYTYQHEVKGESDGWHVLFGGFALCITIPWVILFSLVFYPSTLAIALLVLIAHLTRYARRHKKLFDLHIKDKNAHK